jgi:hypothetical protein
MTSETSNKPTLVSRYQALAAALQGMPDAEFVLGGKTYAKATLVALLTGYVTATEAVKPARQQWQKAIGDAKAALATAKPVRALLKTYLQGKLGKASPDLATYGFDPTRPPKTTVAGKASGVVKSAATRSARNTMGTQQKKTVKGDVVGVELTPVTAGAPAKAPASPGGGGTATGAPAAPATRT